MVSATQNLAAPSASKTFAVSVRESLESIVVAFALAFIFRAFIVEAFVIPTGSMAPTLYGQQVTHTCSTCGFEYARGIDPDQFEPGTRPLDLTLKCPNCASTADKVPGRELIRPSSGDRILVHKWPFSLGGELGPERWDVTVFKDPHNGTVNYIKRLVGKPGEILEIIHGDIYTAPLEIVQQKDPGLIAEMDQLRRDLYQYARGKLAVEQDQVAARYQAVNARLLPFLKIQRKALDAPQAQASLWFNVYNRDYLPRTAGHADSDVGWSSRIRTIGSLENEQLDVGRIPPSVRRALEEVQIQLPENPAVVVEQPGRQWRVAFPGGDLILAQEENRLAVYDAAARAAWDTSSGQIAFKSPSGRPEYIRFVGKPLDDFYGYNYDHSRNTPSQRRVPVGDLRLAFTWFPEAGEGGLLLEMNRHKDRFVALLRMDGTVEIQHWAPEAVKPAIIGRVKLEPFRPNQAVPLEFVNVDFRVSLSIDGQEVLASTDEQYAPDVAELLTRNGEDPAQTVPSQVRIGGYQMQFRLDHVELDRDVYYRSSLITESGSHHLRPGGSYQMVPNPFCQWPGWGTQGWPIMLRNGPVQEYFMLGDNSPGSKDSRLWWEIGPHLLHLEAEYQVGTVPADQMIGQAFFVYWPSGYRRGWTADIGIIPNFGRMRWIR